MDTIIIILILASTLLFWKFPKKKWGIIIFCIAFVAAVLLFCYHITSSLNLNF